MTQSPPGREPSGRPRALALDEYLERWSRLHGGYRPADSALVRGWLTIVYAAARPLARAGVHPDALTALGVAVAGAAAVVSAVGGRWLFLAAALVAVAGLLDSVDGAVALLLDRVTRWGYVLDSAADRVGDVLLVSALWLAGGGPVVAVAGGGLALLHEYVRARAVGAGLTEIGVLTVWERPTRVIVTGMFLLAGGVLTAETWPRAGAWAWVGLGAIGLAQLVVDIRRRLAGSGSG